MGQPQLFTCACPNCGVAVVVPAADLNKPVVPRCRCTTRESVDTPFARREWEATRDPRLLREALAALGWKLTPRQVRLIAVGIARVAYGWCRNYWFRQAITCGEELANSGTSTERHEEIRAGLGPFAVLRYRSPTEWGIVGLACVADDPTANFTWLEQQVPGVVVEVYRDVVSNPFVTIDWKPDWRTSDVVALCRTAYDRHAFDVMPILADALLDAGCESRFILQHCRSDARHVRGCWVLDGLLGKG
jgi:hypothetical protein